MCRALSLQGDRTLKISNYVVKKVAESLKKLLNPIALNLNYLGRLSVFSLNMHCVSDNRFDEQIRDHIIFKNSEGKYVTLPEYRESIPETYKTKVGDKVIYFEKGKSDPALRSQLLSEKSIRWKRKIILILTSCSMWNPTRWVTILICLGRR